MNFDFFKNISPARRGVILLIIIYTGFISLGLPDTILGVAWDKMHRDFAQPLAYAGFITMLLTLCSAASSFASGAILRFLGTGKLLMICGYITGLSLLGYALSPFFWVLLLLTIPLGFGQGAVDTGMNFYVAKHYSSRVMSWLHCCWGIGATIGPIIAASVINFGSSWRWAYTTVAIVQLTLATVFFFSLGLWDKTKGSIESTTENPTGKVNRDIRFWLCTLTFFIYTAIEVSPGLWGYVFLTTCRGISPEKAGFWIACYWGGLTAGRFLIGIFANRLGNRLLIRASAAGAIIGSALMALPFGGYLPLLALMLIGFSLASIYPCMMHEAPRRFDDITAATLTGYQGGAAMLGMAGMPAALGYIASRTTFECLPYWVLTGAVLILLMQFKIDAKAN